MLPPNTRTVYESTETAVKAVQWTLTRNGITTILEHIEVAERGGRIKGYWLVETAERLVLLRPCFELMAGINKHPALKNPELIMLSNLDIVSLSIKEAVLGVYGNPVQRITYGNFYINEDGTISTECTYLFLDFEAGKS